MRKRSISKGRSASKGQIVINKKPTFYILRSQSSQLYIGSTRNINQRYKDHQSGRGCRTNKHDPPAELVYTEEFDNLTAAQKREYQVKHWSRAKKEALITGDMDKLKKLAKRKKK